MRKQKQLLASITNLQESDHLNDTKILLDTSQVLFLALIFIILASICIPTLILQLSLPHLLELLFRHGLSRRVLNLLKVEHLPEFFEPLQILEVVEPSKEVAVVEEVEDVEVDDHLVYPAVHIEIGTGDVGPFQEGLCLE